MTKAAEMSWVEFERRAPQVPYWIVAIGSVEQHGPHLPLNSDTLVAEKLATEACKRHGAVILDTVTTGVLFAFAHWPGALSIPDAVLAGHLVAVAGAAAAYKNRLLFLNGHDENQAPLLCAAREVANRYGTDVVVVEWAELVSDVIAQVCTFKSESHAGEALTSLLLHWYPEQVRVEAIVPGDPTTGELLRDDLHHPVRAHHVTRVTRTPRSTGILGDPTGATPEKGGAIGSALVERLAAVVEERGWV